MALPIGNLTGLSGQFDNMAALMQNVPSQLQGGTSVLTPPKQIEQFTPFDQQQEWTPAKQMPGADYGSTEFGTGGPTKQSPLDLANTFPQLQLSPAPHADPGLPGQVGSFGGQQSMLNNYDDAFARAGAKYGIDANWLKSIAAIEGHYDNSVDAYGAVGIMGIMPGGYGSLEAQYPGWRTDPAQNIALGAAILAAKIRENGGTIEGGIQGYLGWGTDAYGTTPGGYLAQAQKYYGQLQQSGGSFGGGSGGSGSLSTMFGSATVPDWGEFNQPSGNGLYGYGAQYGLSGTTHTGVDVPMSVGTAYRAPMSGVVTCGGTGNGSGADGGGCAAFSDYYGRGAGRVEVKLDNGTVLIFGHSSTSALQPGQRFNAGDVLGTSGGMNSPHIHLEARVRDSSTPSGYRIVDPRTVLGGGGGGFGGQNVLPNQQQQGAYGGVASSIHSFLQGYRR